MPSIFIVDAAAGITDLNEAMADVLRKNFPNRFSVLLTKLIITKGCWRLQSSMDLGLDNIFFISRHEWKR